jgi:hypothetical protein
MITSIQAYHKETKKSLWTTKILIIAPLVNDHNLQSRGINGSKKEYAYFKIKYLV